MEAWRDHQGIRETDEEVGHRFTAVAGWPPERCDTLLCLRCRACSVHSISLVSSFLGC
jgi:hypothetical protein